MTTNYPGAARPHETEPGTGQLSRRLLGKTAWSVNPIGIGTWSMGGAWGAIDDGASRQALRVAVAEGVDFFDTADNYGCGHSEVLLGEVLSALEAVANVLPARLCGNGLRETSEQQPRMRSPYETLGYSGISFVVNL